MDSAAPNPQKGWELYHQAKERANAKQYEEALELCREAWRAFRDNQPDHLKNLYARCIYHAQLKPLAQADVAELEDDESPDTVGRCDRAIKAVEAICSMTSQGQYSYYTISILTLIKTLKRTQGRWSDVESWTARLDPDGLSTKPFVFIDNDGKERELASDLEQWYAARVRALLETQKFDACVALAKNYLERFQVTHYGYEVWIPYWQAKALICLKRAPEALQLMDMVVAKSRKSHTLTLHSKAREAAGDLAGAWLAALEAVHESVEPKQLLSPAGQLAHLLEIKDDRGELWRKTIELMVRIRSTEDWRIPGSLQTKAAEAGIADSNLNRIDNLNALLRELRPLWWEAWIEAEPRLSGIIDRVLQKACFIRMDCGKSLYCPGRELPKNARQSARVSFWIRAGFDAAKGRDSQQAIQVRLQHS